MGENHFAAAPSAVYGGVLLMASIAYRVLQRTIIASQGTHSLLKKALGSDWKGLLSPLIYFLGILAAFVSPGISQALYVLVALAWLVPSRRIEDALVSKEA